MTEAPSIDETLRPLRDAGLEAASQVPGLVRSYLADVRSHLAHLHRATGSGRLVNEANSDLTDRLVRRLFVLAEDSVLAAGAEIERGVCVMAVGGYARREMSIHSDVDLLVLYRHDLSPYVVSISERLQYWMWDAGMEIGCATRTIEQTVELGGEDATVRTAVLTARFLCGDGEFFHEFADAMRRALLPDTEAFIAQQRESLRSRHKAFGESLFLLEPNVKESAGGLRDYHAAYWVARGAQPSTRDLDDLLHFGLLTEAEMDEYRSALDFLWRVRNDMHLRAKRRSDQMSFELQEFVAEALGYGSRVQGQTELPVERFMGDYYRHARAIQNYSELVIEQCAARVARVPERRDSRDVEHGFRIAHNQLEIPHSAHLRQDPVRVLRAFCVAQDHDVPLSRIARRLIRENLELVDDEFVRNPECRDVFLSILGAEHRVMRTLMDMNEVGLLAAYLPEWAHIVCRWQHVLYHTYTVDVHSIFLVEELRRLWKKEYIKAVPDLTELVRASDELPLLFLGCLLHDVGKGFGSDHSRHGTVRARACLERMGLDPELRERVIFLVERHLWMSHLAQRRDLSDPKLILDFARLCGDRRNLRNLYLLTFADIRACSRTAWTTWKGQLLRELFERTAEFLETGADDSHKAAELIDARVDIRRESARESLLAQGVGAAKISAFFDGMPRRYFIGHTPRQISRHALVFLRLQQTSEMTVAFREMRGDFTEFILCARDSHGLYARVAGVLMARGLNILGSHVYSSRSGVALEIYRLSTPPGGREELDLEWGKLEIALRRVLSAETSVEELLEQRRRPVGVRLRPPAQQAPIVLISNAESDFYTLVDITTDDRIGLLYDLTRTIADHDLEIFISKAATIRDQVGDTFYLKDRQGGKLRDPERLQALRDALLEVVRKGEDGESS